MRHQVESSTSVVFQAVVSLREADQVATRETVAPASGSDVGGNHQIPRFAFPRRGAGLSQGDLLGTPLSASEREIAELALSYPHEFGEWA